MCHSGMSVTAEGILLKCEGEKERTLLAPSDFCFAKPTFSSGNGNPFVCFADISPDRGISLKGQAREERGFVPRGLSGAVAEG